MCFTAPAFSSEGYAGAEACADCHAAEWAAQRNSHHARALRPILETPLPSLLAGLPVQERSGITFEYQPAARGLLLTVSKRGERLSAMLEWAFGSGAQAYTPVGRYGGRYVEHRVSFYTSAGRPARTLGHPAEASRSLESALGVVQDPTTIFRCFNCHATGVRPGPDLSAMQPGVSCERCHGPGMDHIAAARAGRPRSEVRARIEAFSGAEPAASVRFCGQCHRLPSPRSSTQPEVEDPLSIRFQPVGLLASRCFRISGALSCVTCHNPHSDAPRDAEYYVARCVRCHEPRHGARLPSCGLSERRNCLPCHMQRRSPAQFLAFTDHRIRVY